MAQRALEKQVKDLLSQVVYIKPNPSDKIVVFMPAVTPSAVVQHMNEGLNQLFPDVLWVVIAGATHVVHEAAPVGGEAPQSATGTMAAQNPLCECRPDGNCEHNGIVKP